MWKYNFKVTLDLSHYQVYSNYLLYEKENNNTAGDLERQIYGANVPSWKDCINIVVGNSLVQLHFTRGVLDSRVCKDPKHPGISLTLLIQRPFQGRSFTPMPWPPTPPSDPTQRQLSYCFS